MYVKNRKNKTTQIWPKAIQNLTAHGNAGNERCKHAMFIIMDAKHFPVSSVSVAQS